MNRKEREFLLEEYRANWAHLGLLDTRRFQILEYYVAFFGLSTAGIGGMLQLTSLNQSLKFGLVAMLAANVMILSEACIGIIRVQRKAIERYRDRIREIRRLMLQFTQDADLQELLTLKTGRGYIETRPTTRKSLRFLDILDESKHSTDLYVKVILDVGFVVSFVTFLVSSGALVISALE